MAQQLRRAGERVDFLGLLDANPVRDPLTGMTTAESPHLAVLDRAVGALDHPDGFDEAGRRAKELSVSGLLGPVPEGLTGEAVRSHLDAARAGLRAAMCYRAEPYDGVVHLFQADACSEPIRQALLDELRALAPGRIRVALVPGDHSAMLRGSQADALARALDAAIGGRYDDGMADERNDGE